MRSLSRLALVLGLASRPADANLFDVVRRDWLALIARSSTRVIVLGDRAECLNLKMELSSRVQAGEFVVDAFADAAARYSTDDDTRSRGGLLGERLPQGVVRSRIIDRLCFTAPLGQIVGPIESEQGWHLVLVQERLNCRLDDGKTCVVAEPIVEDKEASGDSAPRFRSVVVAQAPNGASPLALPSMTPAVVSAVALCGTVLVFGQVLAEVASWVPPPEGMV